jgi:hypothetical protein
MTDLFRYLEWRSPKLEPMDAIAPEGDSPLRESLRAARDDQNPVQAMSEIAADFAASEAYALSSEELHFLVPYKRTERVARSWLPDSDRSLGEALLVLFDTVELGQVVTSEEFREDKQRVHDSLIAAKLALDYQKDVPLLLSIARAIYLIEIASEDAPSLNSEIGVLKALGALFVIPDEYLAGDRVPLPAPVDTSTDNHPSSRLAALTQRQRDLEETYQFFSTLENSKLQITPRDESELADHLNDFQAISHVSSLPQQLFVAREVIEQLSPGVRTSLAELQIDPFQTTVPAMLAGIKEELAQVHQEQLAIEPLVSSPVYQVGQYFFTVSAGPTASIPFLGAAPQVKIKPIGFGDLQVVKQHIVRYEPGEISYIENVMESEQYGRELQRREFSEEFTLSERERVREEERDLQSTDRFELRTEAETTARNTATTTSGNTVTSQYGSLVETRATNFARDVINRAVNKLTERVREQRSIRIQRELTDKTSHTFDNAKGDTHIRGIYQWLDKVYECQVYNFGKRLLYEAIIPEPSAFLHELNMDKVQPEGMRLTRPPAITFGPKDLQAWNYLTYAKLYDVVGAVEPPPAEYLNIPKNVNASKDADGLISSSENIPVPDGYSAYGMAYARYNLFGSGPLSIVTGYRDALNVPGFHGETGNLPVYISASGISRFIMNFMLVCQRLASHLEKWQIRTYETLQKGYRKQLADYEERLANMQALARTQALLSGGTRRNREIERTELKKAFLTILTNQHFDAFNGIGKDAALGYLQTDIHAAVNQAGFISFFERAFEWENILYYFYPYFWGRKVEWINRVGIQDSDTQFEAFLKAGSARVVVPVRPGFEAALAHYMETGQVWLGEDEPDMYSPLFVSILEELKSRDQAPGDEIPVGDPWEVHLPTTLVMLRGDDKLPEWRKDAAGNWVPEN